MSMPGNRPPPGQGIGGCLAFALVLGGIVLLLPGLCSLVFMGAFGAQDGSGLQVLWLITFLIAGGGMWMIIWAVRNR